MPREELFLQDIIEAADAIERFLKNIKKDDFLSNEILQSAILHKLTIIGEASARLPEDLRNRHFEIEWKPIIGPRNIVVHAYFSVNWKTIWSTVNDDVPALREQISQILQSEFPDFELRTEK